MKKFIVSAFCLILLLLLISDVLKSEKDKILVIGIDGLDWRIADPLMEAGKLPWLKKLKDEGAWGDLMTLNDLPLSPVIWTSIATGKVPSKHKITWFLVDGPNGTKVPVGSNDRAVEAIWNIAAENEKKVGVVGWWATTPAEDVGDGIIISDALGYHGFGSSGQGLPDHLKTYPEELFSEYQPLMPPVHQIGYQEARRFFNMTEDAYSEESFSPSRSPRPNPRNPIHLFQEYISTTLGYTNISEKLLAKEVFDMFMVYYEATDSMCHLFMKYAPPKLPWINEEDFKKYSNAVDEYYLLVDDEMGKLLEKIDDSWTVVLLSDHGFRSGNRRPKSTDTIDVHGAHLDHEPEGVLVVKGPGIKKGYEIKGANVLDVCPTLLHLMNIPAATDMDGKVLTQIYEVPVPAQSVEYVATHEPPDGRTKRSANPTDDANQNFLSNEAMERLKTLGYISSTGEPVKQHSHSHTDSSVPEKDTLEVSDGSGASNTPEQIGNLGRIHLRNGEIDKALAAFLKIVELKPDDAGAWVQIGQIRMYQGLGGEALRCFIKALSLDPNNIAVLMQLAELKSRQGRLGEAVQHYKQVISIQDRLAAPYIGLGDALQRLGRLPQAESVLVHASELDPSSFQARYNLGVVYLRQEKLDDAKSAFEESLELIPDSSISLNNLAQVLIRQEDEKGGIELLRKAADVDPTHLESRFNLGVILLKRGDCEEALSWLEKALEVDPQMTSAIYQAAVAELCLEKISEALNRLAVLVRLDQRHVNGWILLGRITARAGQSNESLGYLRQAIMIQGKDLAISLRQQPDFKDLDWPELPSSDSENLAPSVPEKKTGETATPDNSGG